MTLATEPRLFRTPRLSEALTYTFQERSQPTKLHDVDSQFDSHTDGLTATRTDAGEQREGIPYLPRTAVDAAEQSAYIWQTEGSGFDPRQLHHLPHSIPSASSLWFRRCQ